MKLKLSIICSLIFLANCASYTNQYHGKSKIKYYGDFTIDQLVSVYDGDTITVDINNCHPLLCKKIKIRLRGIDTPEIRSKCKKEHVLAIKARDELRILLKNAKIIYLKNTSRGKYFRIIASVYADDIDVAKILLDKNLAYKYQGGTKNSWCD